MLIATAIAAQGDVRRFDGDWYSPQWRYGYRLKDGVGVATSSNSPNFRPGDVIIRIRATKSNSFAGEQVYRDGRWYRIQGALGADGRLHVKGERNIAWSMERVGAAPAAPAIPAAPAQDRPIQTHDVLSAAEIRSRYAIIKSIAEKRDAQHERTWRRSRVEKAVELGSCGTEVENIGTSQFDATANLILLASEVVRLGNRLHWLGYPRSLAQPLLDEWEKRTIEAIVEAADDPLRLERVYFDSDPPLDEILKVAGRHRESNAHLPEITIETACGGHAIAVPVNLVTQPRGGAVFLIPVFFYELCRAQNEDPEDTARCNRWQEAVTGTNTEVLGDYRYIARWPDGAIRRGRLSFNGSETGRTIIFRRP